MHTHKHRHQEDFQSKQFLSRLLDSPSTSLSKQSSFFFVISQGHTLLLLQGKNTNMGKIFLVEIFKQGFMFYKYHFKFHHKFNNYFSPFYLQALKFQVFLIVHITTKTGTKKISSLNSYCLDFQTSPSTSLSKQDNLVLKQG